MNDSSQLSPDSRPDSEPSLSRRTLLRAALCAPIALAASRVIVAPAQAAEMSGPHKLPPLPYAASALNPTIDTLTMRTHHDKHHAKYVDELNKALRGAPAQFRTMSPQGLLQNLDKMPQPLRDKVRNNAGGHVNHTMFWAIMSPDGGGRPTGEIAQAINSKFGSFDKFRAQFEDAGAKRFGSGWVWLAADRSGAMKIISTPNQDNPLLLNHYPIMGNDVWEHAYYLKYKNKRPDYLKAWWNVTNWDAINSRLRWMNANWVANTA